MNSGDNIGKKQNSASLVVLWLPAPEDPTILHDLFTDLLSEQVRIIPAQFLLSHVPGDFKNKWKSLCEKKKTDKLVKLYIDLPSIHPDIFKNKSQMARIRRSSPHDYWTQEKILLVPSREESNLHFEDYEEIFNIINPIRKCEIRLRKKDKYISGKMPNVPVIYYPEELERLLVLLRPIISVPSYEIDIDKALLSTTYDQDECKAISGEEIATGVKDKDIKGAGKSVSDILSEDRDTKDLDESLKSLMGQGIARDDIFSNIKEIERERPRITAAYPEAIAPSSWADVEIFIYLKSYRKLVEKEIKRLQDHEDLDYTDTSSIFPKSLPAGCPVRIVMESDSLNINPPEITIRWLEPYNRLPFRIATKDANKEGYSTSLDIEVFADDLPVTSMGLSIVVDSNINREQSEPATTDAAFYENIFASYAREDLEMVKHLKERYKALGLYMFIDLDDLRSGDTWQDKLSDKIDESDLFQLFWSEHAKKSEYVTVEWQQALRAREIKGNRFIRPVYWDEPIPEVPEELAKINFHKLSFVDS